LALLCEIGFGVDGQLVDGGNAGDQINSELLVLRAHGLMSFEVLANQNDFYAAHFGFIKQPLSTLGAIAWFYEPDIANRRDFGAVLGVGGINGDFMVQRRAGSLHNIALA
jgi:hypothetical protein